MHRSLSGRLWHDHPTPPEGAVLARSLGLHPLVANLLAQRGHLTPQAASQFLSPQLSHLPDPLTIAAMAHAIAILTTTITQRQTIAIFGDYDVDGTCATAILYKYFNSLGLKTLTYIPNRLTEGYGPTPAAFNSLIQQGAQLIITVDCGTTAHAAIAHAARRGVPVIITDHHQPDGPLPPAAAVLNPQRADDTSDLRCLCGSGLAFYLLMALGRHLRQQGYFTDNNIPEPKLTQWLDLVALATVADVMPLTGPNRVLVAKGLQQLTTWQYPGLAALAQAAGVGTELSTYTLGFQLGPRINAAGRVGSATTALQLLTATDDTAAAPLAEHLNQLNHQRQSIEKDVQAQAMAQAQAQADAGAPAIIVCGDDWHPGVLGIVAGRLKEAFLRPTFVLSHTTTGPSAGQVTGSGRSLPGLNLGAAVHAAHAHIIKGGGHAMAAGVTLTYENREAFKQSIFAYLQAEIDANPTQFPPQLPMAQRLAPPHSVHASLTTGGASLTLVQQLQQLGPFGPSNPEPQLALGPTTITYAKTMGTEGQHLRLTLPSSADDDKVSIVAFNAMNGPLGPALMAHAGRTVTLLGHLRTNTFNGRTTLDFHLTDAHWGPWPT